MVAEDVRGANLTLVGVLLHATQGAGGAERPLLGSRESVQLSFHLSEEALEERKVEQQSTDSVSTKLTTAVLSLHSQGK